MLLKVSRHVICLLLHVLSVMAVCYNPEPFDEVHINETTTSSYGPLFTITATDAVINFDINPMLGESSENYSRYFKTEITDFDKWHIILKEPLDLDKFTGATWDNNGGIHFQIDFRCMDTTTDREYRYTRMLYVSAVDEYIPELDPQIDFKIYEDDPLGSVFGSIREAVQDRDLFDYYTDVYFFTTTDYDEDPSKDSRLILNVDQYGNLHLKRHIDYEANDHEFFTRTFGRNQKNQTLQTFVHFIIININDSPPLFVYNGCTLNCSVSHYKTKIYPNFKGLIDNFEHGIVQAIDPDGDVILGYEFIGGSPINYTAYLTIDSNSGIIMVKKPPSNGDITLLSAIIRTQSLTVLHTHEPAPSSEAYTIIMLWIDGEDDILKDKAGFSTNRSERNFQNPFNVFCSILIAVLHM